MSASFRIGSYDLNELIKSARDTYGPVRITCTDSEMVRILNMSPDRNYKYDEEWIKQIRNSKYGTETYVHTFMSGAILYTDHNKNSFIIIFYDNTGLDLNSALSELEYLDSLLRAHRSFYRARYYAALTLKHAVKNKCDDRIRCIGNLDGRELTFNFGNYYKPQPSSAVIINTATSIDEITNSAFTKVAVRCLKLLGFNTKEQLLGCSPDDVYKQLISLDGCGKKTATNIKDYITRETNK